MNTLFMLMARYDGAPMVPAERVRADFFDSMTLPVFLRKAQAGDIPLPIVRMDRGQKAARMIHLKDLADYIDARRKEALDEARKMAS